jgi:hypothetical protein
MQISVSQKGENMNKLIPYSEYPFKNYNLESSLLVDDFDHKAFPPICVMSGMIDWLDEDDAAWWGGPWNDRYVGCMVSDYSNTMDLPSVEVLQAKLNDYVKYSTRYIDRNLLSRLFSDFKKDIYGWVVESSSGQKCSCSTMTHHQFDIVINAMTDEELRKWRDDTENAKMSLYGEFVKAVPCKQFPVEIYLFGNDDCSYTITVQTPQMAKEMVDDILRKPSMDYVKKNFVFTN